jgi:hypothetical protein
MVHLYAAASRCQLTFVNWLPHCAAGRDAVSSGKGRMAARGAKGLSRYLSASMQ